MAQDNYWKQVAAEYQANPKYVERPAGTQLCPSCDEEFVLDWGYAFLRAYAGRVYFCSTQCKLRWRKTEMTEEDGYIGETLGRGHDILTASDKSFEWD